MKIRVAYSIDVDDDYRRAINLFYGQEGLASREEVIRWVRTYGTSEDENLWMLDQKEPDDQETD